MTPNDYKLAFQVNAEVNNSVAYRSDAEQYHRPEHWVPAGQFGDCEDYALAKRGHLLAAGWPLKDLALVSCFIGGEIGHCVLWVMTDRGGYILDNRDPSPMPPEVLDYRWEKMLCGSEWRRLQGWQ